MIRRVMIRRVRSSGLVLAVAPIAAPVPCELAAQVAFEDLFTVVDTLVLEERDEALNAAPSLRRDPAGGWLVSDRQENQVRVYDADGRLLHWFGREGRGPGEFDDLAGAVRMPSGDIVTVADDGRIAVWSPEGMFRRQFRVEARGVTDVALVPPDTVVFVSVPMLARSSASAPVLHVVHIGSDTALAHVFEPVIAPGAASAWVTVHGASLTRLSTGAHLLTLPMADTLYEISAFLPLATTRIRRTTEIDGSPTLQAYDPSTDLYVFADPTTLEPNRFLLARLNAGAIRISK